MDIEESNNSGIRSYIAYAIVFVTLLIVLTAGATYAFFKVNSSDFSTSSTINSTMDCLNISYSETGTIDLDYQYPITDTFALQDNNVEPITVTVTNNCTNNGGSINYTLALTSLSEDSGYIPDNKMRVNVKRKIGSDTETTFINTGYLSSLTALSSGNAYNFLTSDLASRNETSSYTNKNMYQIDTYNVASNSVNIYKIYLWVDYWEGDTTQAGVYNNTTQDKDFKADVSLVLNP